MMPKTRIAKRVRLPKTRTAMKIQPMKKRNPRRVQRLATTNRKATRKISWATTTTGWVFRSLMLHLANSGTSGAIETVETDSDKTGNNNKKCHRIRTFRTSSNRQCPTWECRLGCRCRMVWGCLCLCLISFPWDLWVWVCPVCLWVRISEIFPRLRIKTRTRIDPKTRRVSSTKLIKKWKKSKKNSQGNRPRGGKTKARARMRIKIRIPRQI